jgi:hypothetical protein
MDIDRHSLDKGYGGFYLEDGLSREGNGILEYVAALERVNDQLLMTPRYCIQLLAKFKNLTPDSEG